MASKYPLTCPDCSRIYKEKTSFSRHKRLVNDESVCMRAQRSVNKLNVVASNGGCITAVSNIDHSTVTVTNNIVNHGLPEWIDPAQFKESIQQVKKVIDLLEKKGIEGPEKTDAYIRKETFVYADFVKCFRENCQKTVREVVDLVQHLTPAKTARIAPLRILYEHMFESKSKDHMLCFEDLHRRPFHLKHGSNGACDVLTRNVTLEWETKHWQSLLSDILFMLGKRIFEYMEAIDLDYLIEEEEVKTPDEDPVEEECFETAEEEQKARKKREEKLKLREEKERAKEKARMLANTHPFVKWWRTIRGAQTLQDDPDVNKLMATISSRLITECRNDTNVGWHRLINYCRCLHEKGDIKVAPADEDPVAVLQREIDALQLAYDDAYDNADDDVLEEELKTKLDEKKRECKMLKKKNPPSFPDARYAVRQLSTSC